MKKDIEAEGEDEDGSTNLAAAAGLKRQETKLVPGGDSAASKELARLDDVLMLPEMEYYLSEQPGRDRRERDVSVWAVCVSCIHVVRMEAPF